MDAEGIGGGVYNVACGERVSLNRLLAELRELLGSDIEALREPPRPADVRHTLADLSRARAYLGYEPSVRWRRGLERTVRHFQEQNRQPGLPSATAREIEAA
jgi:nucleoside-diphosphate-sugar epimerase